MAFWRTEDPRCHLSKGPASQPPLSTPLCLKLGTVSAFSSENGRRSRELWEALFCHFWGAPVAGWWLPGSQLGPLLTVESWEIPSHCSHLQNGNRNTTWRPYNMAMGAAGLGGGHWAAPREVTQETSCSGPQANSGELRPSMMGGLHAPGPSRDGQFPL